MYLFRIACAPKDRLGSCLSEGARLRAQWFVDQRVLEERWRPRPPPSRRVLAAVAAWHALQLEWRPSCPLLHHGRAIRGFRSRSQRAIPSSHRRPKRRARAECDRRSGSGAPSTSPPCACTPEPRAFLRRWVWPQLAVLCTVGAFVVFGGGVGRQDACRPPTRSQTPSSLPVAPTRSPPLPYPMSTGHVFARPKLPSRSSGSMPTTMNPFGRYTRRQIHAELSSDML
jgi:hypothetical protein